MRALLAVLLVVSAGFAALIALNRHAAPPPGAASEATSRNAEVAASSSTENAAPLSQGVGTDRPAVAPPAEPQRIPAAIQDPGLAGTALDHGGHALPGLCIRLLPEGKAEGDAHWAKTDDEGRFQFPDVHGTFECAIWSHVRFAKQVTVAPGEHQSVVLQVPEPCILVMGAVTAGTRTIADRTVTVQGQDRIGEVHHDAHTNRDGVYRHLLRPGSYEI